MCNSFDPMDCSRQASLSIGFSRQEYWSRLLFPSLWDYSHPEIEHRSPALQADALLTELWGNPTHWIMIIFSEQLTHRVSLVAQLVKNPPAMREAWVWSLGWEDPLKKGTATQLQYSGLENSVDSIVHGVTKSWTWLNDFHFHLVFPGG